MAGSIRTQEKCGCARTFVFIKDGKYSFLECPICRKRAATYYIDARCKDFRPLKTIWKDPKSNEIFRDYESAERVLNSMREAVQKRAFDADNFIAKELDKVKVSAKAEVWLKRIQLDKSYSYVRHCRTEFDLHINPFIGHFDVRELRTHNITDLYYHLVEKVSERTGRKLEPKAIKNIMADFRTFLVSLDDLVPQLPKFPIIKVPEKAAGWINADKQRQIVNAIPEHHRLIFETLIELACRPGEVCALKKRDLIDGEVCIERAFDEKGNLKPRKSGKVLYRGISLVLWTELQTMAKTLFPESWLFIDGFGKPYSQGRLYDIWKRACGADLNISLYAGTRRSRASQKRLELEKEISGKIAAELGNTKEVAMKHYARSRGEEI